MNKNAKFFLDYLKEEKKVSKNTYESYSRDILSFEMFLNNLGIFDIEHITENTILLYRMSLEEKGRSNSTIARHLATLRKFFDYLFINKLIEQNPMRDIASPRIKKKSLELLSSDEVNELLDAPDKTSRTGFRDIALLNLIYYTDIRVSELVNLNIDDFNSQIGYLRCKNNRDQDRIIPLDKVALSFVSKYIEFNRINLSNQDEIVLFVNSNGTRMSRQGFWKIIKRYALKANISKQITFNVLRNSFLLHMLKNGDNNIDIDRLLKYTNQN